MIYKIHPVKEETIMAVKLRMMRIGRRNRPFFRINAVESRTPRDGKTLEKLGSYDPIEKDPAKQIVLNRERIQYWLDKGAIPSDTVSQILLRAGLKHKYAEEKTARRSKARAIARARGKLFTKAERIAAEKAAKGIDEKAEAEAKAAAETKARAEADEKVRAEAKAREEKAKAEAEEKLRAEAKAKEEKEKAKAQIVEEKAPPEPEAKAEAVEQKPQDEPQAKPESQKD